jgi:hypothetical protein
MVDQSLCQVPELYQSEPPTVGQCHAPQLSQSIAVFIEVTIFGAAKNFCLAVNRGASYSWRMPWLI